MADENSTSVTQFVFPGDGKAIRSLILPNGEPGFVGKDVAERLGYADTSDAIARHCRGSVIRLPIPDALGRTQETRILTEPDVLRLIVSSNLPAAQEFERWVFEDVLPSIRRTGGYTMQPQKTSSAEDMETMRTMSSRELATIADKRHDNVMRVCRDLRDTGVSRKFRTPPTPTNRTARKVNHEQHHNIQF